MKIGIILQARMGSSRLPGKVLKKIGNRTLLGHIVFRLSFLKAKVKLVIATSTLEKDNPIEEFCKSEMVECFRGSELHVLERYYLCAKKYKFDHIVRMTGDNPFPDIEELGNLLDLHLSSGGDYSNSFSSLPIGVGAEVFTFSALQKSFLEGKEPKHIEHVNEYILDYPSKFRIRQLKVVDTKNFPQVRLTVDTLDDFDKACFIVENVTNGFITTQEAIDLSKQWDLK